MLLVPRVLGASSCRFVIVEQWTFGRLSSGWMQKAIISSFEKVQFIVSLSCYYLDFTH